MVDWGSLRLLQTRSGILDFVVIVAVIVVAKTVSLIAASGVGIALAIALFVREQTGASVVRHKSYGSHLFSRQIRSEKAMAVLAQRAEGTAIFELQGSLFFGTTDQLLSALEADLKSSQYIILDLRRVQTVDVTAAHMLENIENMLSERGAHLLFSSLPRRLPSGRDMQACMELRQLQPGEKVFSLTTTRATSCT